MFRKSIITTAALALVATSSLGAATTAASAKDGRRTAAIAGAVIGLGALAIAGKAYAGSHHGQRYEDHRFGGHRPANYPGHGYQFANSYGFEAPRKCWDKPVTRWDAYAGERIVIGYKTVCNR